METNKVVCQDCGIEYGTSQYYLSRVEGQKRMPICTYCFERDFTSGSVETLLRKYNIPYICELWDEVSRSHGGNAIIPQYMKALNLPQYINLRWKDTNWNKKDSKEESNFYEGIIKQLKVEAKKLSDKLTIAINQTDMQLYLGTVKSLKETLSLIEKYDWKLTYSEYETKDDNGNIIQQVSVWEINHDNQIRNHKFWNVENALDKIKIDATGLYINNININELSKHK